MTSKKKVNGLSKRTEDENSVDQAIQHYKELNKTLIQRAFILISVSLLVFGLMLQQANVKDEAAMLSGTINLLETMRNTSDLEVYIKENELMLYVHNATLLNNEIDEMIEVLKKSNFQDRSIISETIRKLYTQEKYLVLKKSEINIFGFNIPSNAGLYCIPIVLVFLFHELSRLVHSRKELLRKIPAYKLKNSNSSDFLHINEGSSGVYMRYHILISHIIIAGFLLVTVLTSLNFILVYSIGIELIVISLYRWILAIIIIIEFALIAYNINVFGIRHIGDLMKIFF